MCRASLSDPANIYSINIYVNLHEKLLHTAEIPYVKMESETGTWHNAKYLHFPATEVGQLSTKCLRRKTSQHSGCVKYM